ALPPYIPNKKSRETRIQLKLCNSWEVGTELVKRSYVRIDTEYEVPLDMLIEAYRSDGLRLMLQSDSLQKVLKNVRVEQELSQMVPFLAAAEHPDQSEERSAIDGCLEMNTSTLPPNQC
ncbi:MAG: hypothetical protein M1830_003261, partial [Pleopsidium flavum]